MSAATDDDAAELERMQQLLASAGCAGAHADVAAQLLSFERDEARAVRAAAEHYAARLGAAAAASGLAQGGRAGVSAAAVDVECVRLACLERRLLQAPLRAASLEAARATNARTVAWPLGPQLRVPIGCAAAERSAAILDLLPEPPLAPAPGRAADALGVALQSGSLSSLVAGTSTVASASAGAVPHVDSFRLAHGGNEPGGAGEGGAGWSGGQGRAVAAARKRGRERGGLEAFDANDE